MNLSYVFFFNDTATTEIYTLSLHDALPIYRDRSRRGAGSRSGRGSAGAFGARSRLPCPFRSARTAASCRQDRKSTRLNSSHANISYAVFCLKKKKKKQEAYTLCSISRQPYT